jgi:CSLREA domain-containing protein
LFNGQWIFIFLFISCNVSVRTQSQLELPDDNNAFSLIFITQPSVAALAGDNFAIQPIVHVLDINGNLDTTSSNSVTLVAYTDSACTVSISSGTSSGNIVTASSGVVTFTSLDHQKAEVIYYKATSGTLATDCSTSVTITANVKSQLLFSVEPSTTGTEGTNLTQQPTVIIADAYGNQTTDTDNITLALHAGAGCASASSVGMSATTNPLAATAGSSVFAGIAIGDSGTFSIIASSGALTTDCSNTVVISALACTGAETAYDAYGIGTIAKPYLICTGAQLNDLGATGLADGKWALNTYFRLQQNVTLAAYTGTQFNRIGNNTDKFFGYFDGDNRTISNFEYVDAAADYVGFFGEIGIGATVIDLVISATTITGADYVGVLAGSNLGTVTNVSTSGTVTGDQGVGGLVGSIGGTVNGQSSSSANVNSVRVGVTRIGGLTGDVVAGATLTNAFATGTVNAPNSQFCGGLAGYVDANISNVYATGNVIGGFTSGGLVGLLVTTKSITDSYATGNVTGTTVDIGGLVGRLQISSSVTDSYATGNVAGTTTTGGLIGIALATTTIARTFATGNVYATSTASGGLVGENRGAISASYSLGHVYSTANQAGGLVGNLNLAAATINTSWSSSNVYSDGDYVGGLVGQITTGSVSSSYATGTVKGDDYLGGLVGQNSGSAISNSYALGNVIGSTTTSDYVGGVIGQVTSTSTHRRLYARGNVQGFRYVGGAVGSIGAIVTLGELYSSGKIIAHEHFGGLIGHQSAAATISDSFWDVTTSGLGTSNLTTYSQGGTGKTTAQMDDAATFSNWDFTTVWSMRNEADGVDYPQLRDTYKCTGTNRTNSPNYNGTGADIENPLIICTGAQLQQLAATTTDYGKYILIGENINLSAYTLGTWNIIGDVTNKFAGTFDGNSRNGFKISNLTYNANGETNVGLFGRTDTTARILHTETSGFSYTTNGVLGGLVGYNEGVIEGSNFHGTIASATNVVGGLVGNNTGAIKMSSATLTNLISTGANRAGGFVGLNSGNIYYSFSQGTLNPTDGATNGAFVGNHTAGQIVNSYSSASIDSANASAFVGSDGAATTIAYSYAVGAVTAATLGRGFLHTSGGGTRTENFWNETTTGQNSSTGEAANQITGEVTTANMYDDESFYNGWDFFAEATNGLAMIWQDNTGVDYPRLFWENTSSIGYHSGQPSIAISTTPWQILTSANFSNFAVSGTCEFNGTNNVTIGGDAVAQNVNCAAGSWSANIDFTGADYGTVVLLVTHTDPATKNVGQASIALMNKGVDYDCAGAGAQTLYNVIGSGVILDPYIICDTDQWDHLGSAGSADWDMYYEIHDNLDFAALTGTNYDIVGSLATPFTGIIDGRNKTISNFQYSNNNADYIGFLGYLGEDAQFKNLIISLDTNDVIGRDYVGAAVGYSLGNIENIIVNTTEGGIVNGSNADSDHVGGLVGYVGNGTITSSAAKVNVSIIDDFAGGLIGSIDANGETVTITDSFATGAVSTTLGINIGGFVGQTLAGTISITDSYALGNVTANVVAGGFIGYATSSASTLTIERSYALGSVRTSGAATVNSAGGFVGHCNTNCIIRDSFASGTVSANFNAAGGFVGLNVGLIEKSSASGNVFNDNDNTGGFAGRVTAVGTVNTSYSSGEVYNVGGNYTGGFVGIVQGTISECFTLGNVYGDGTGSVGGFLGRAGSASANISNSFAINSVIGNGSVGGFAGDIQNGIIDKVYSVNQFVIGNSNVGGLLGLYAAGTVTNSFWNVTTSGIGTDGNTAGSAGGTGKSTANMQLEATFTAGGWNWEGSGTNTWVMPRDTNSIGYPQLITAGYECYGNDLTDTWAQQKAKYTGADLSDPVIICSATQLNSFRATAADHDLYVRIGETIDYSTGSSTSDTTDYEKVIDGGYRLGYEIQNYTQSAPLFYNIGAGGLVYNIALTDLAVNVTGAAFPFISTIETDAIAAKNYIHGEITATGLTEPIYQVDGKLLMTESNVTINAPGGSGLVNILSGQMAYVKSTGHFYAQNTDTSGLAATSSGTAYSLTNSYSTLNITASGTQDYVGIMNADTNSLATYHFYAGKITAPDGVRDGLSRVAGSSTNSYWDRSVSTVTTTASSGTGYTTTNMKKDASYTNWDFFGDATALLFHIWGIDEDFSYPYLLWEKTPAPSNLSYAYTNYTLNQNVAATNNTPTYAGRNVLLFTVSPTLPTGLSLSSTTGIISGTPTVLSGATNYTITAYSLGGKTSTTINIEVATVYFVDSASDSVSGGAVDGICDNGSGRCTLREAIKEANNDGSDIILEPNIYVFSAKQTITNSYDIRGTSTNSTILDGDFAINLFEVASGVTVNFEYLTMQNGYVTAEGGGCLRAEGNVDVNFVHFYNCGTTNAEGGGAVFVETTGTFDASDCYFEYNYTDGDRGSAIYYAGNTTITRCSLLNNRADGAGAGNGTIAGSTASSLVVTNSYFYHNFAGLYGAAIYTGGTGNIDIYKSTFRENHSTTSGGAVAVNSSATVDIYNSTFIANHADSFGALGTDNGTLNLENNSIIFNFARTSGAAVAVIDETGTGTINLINNIIYGNSDATAAFNSCNNGTFASTGFNVSNTASGDCNLVDGDDQPSANPHLTGVGENGGPTPTVALLDDDRVTPVAIDGADNTACTALSATDQRGVARSTCDVGAYEFVAGEPPKFLSYGRSWLGLVKNFQPITLIPTIQGGTPTSYTVSPDLPSGLSLDSNTGIISGIATETTSDYGSTVVITATNSEGSSNTRLKIIVLSGFEVNSTADSADFALNGICEATSGGGNCTLRAAIQEAQDLGGAIGIYLPHATYTVGSVLALDGATGGNIRSIMITGESKNGSIIDGPAAANVFDFDDLRGHISLQNIQVIGTGTTALMITNDANFLMAATSLSQTDFNNNTGASTINNTAGDMFIEYSDFSDNIDVGVNYNGGVINHNSARARLVINDSNFTSNRTLPLGFGSAMYLTSLSHFKIFHNNFYQNEAGRSGTITTDGCPGLLYGNTFVENTVGDRGAGVHVSATASDPLLIINNTFVGNTAATDDRGVIATAGPTLILANNIFDENYNDDAATPALDICSGVGVFIDGGGNTYDVNDALCVFTAGQLVADPVLTAAPDNTQGGSALYLEPEAGSPVIDYGVQEWCLFIDRDIAGNDRKIDGDNAGSPEQACDGGAFEYR